MAAMDFFVVPTVTFRLIYVLIVIRHERRKVVHFNITEAPTAAWTAQQVINAFPEETAPEYLLRDRDSIYGWAFRRRVEALREVPGKILTSNVSLAPSAASVWTE
jgi:hypothetical protein